MIQIKRTGPSNFNKIVNHEDSNVVFLNTMQYNNYKVYKTSMYTLFLCVLNYENKLLVWDYQCLFKNF